MAVRKKIKSVLSSFAGKILGTDDTSVPLDQLKFLEDYSKRFFFDTYNVEIGKLMDIMRKKHMVDSIYVATRDGVLICSTNGTTKEQVLNEAALFNYITSELAVPEGIFIKSNNWVMFFPHGEKLFAVRAASNLTQTELKALAKEIDEHLSNTEAD